MAAETKSGDLHVSCASTEADLVLVSKEGVRFRVQSDLLRQSSSFFRDMLQVCGGTSSNSADSEIPVDESANLWMTLLDLINPATDCVPEFTSLAEATELTRIAEKYDIKKAIALIRRLIMCDADLQKADPISLYALACRYGWEKEAKQISEMTLNINMNTSDSLKKLEQIEKGADLLRLLNLHRRRKESLDALLTNDHIFLRLSALHQVCEATNASTSQRAPPSSNIFGPASVFSSANSSPTISEHAKSVTRLQALLSMESCASGSELLTHEFWKNPKLDILFKCQKCNGRAFEKIDVIEIFRSVLASFPATI